MHHVIEGEDAAGSESWLVARGSEYWKVWKREWLTCGLACPPARPLPSLALVLLSSLTNSTQQHQLL